MTFYLAIRHVAIWRRNGQEERIRTSGPRLPKTVLYQAELLPDSDTRSTLASCGRRARIGVDSEGGKRAIRSYSFGHGKRSESKCTIRSRAP